MYLQALLSFKEESNALDELDYFNGVADGNNEMMMMMSMEGENQKNSDMNKNVSNIRRNDISESDILENSEQLLDQDFRIFVTKIEFTNLPNIGRIANDNREMSITIRSVGFIFVYLSGSLTLLFLCLFPFRSLQ